jgi:hypothetical protein
VYLRLVPKKTLTRKGKSVTTIVNLKGRKLRAQDCGNCQGSSNDNKIRFAPADENAATAATSQK